MCPTSPYRRYYAEYVREVVSRYPVDYIYAEGVYIRQGFCYCPHCRAQFEATYGRDLAAEAPDSLDFRRFRQDSVDAFHEGIKRAVDETSPQTVVVGCAYPLWMRTTDVTTFREHMDMVARENQWGHHPDVLPQEAGLRMLILKAEARKPLLGTWWPARNVDLDYAARSPAHARLNFMETLAYGAAVQPHLQTLFEVDQTGMPILTELFGCVERARPYLLEARIMPYAAILDWAGSADSENCFGDALKGAYLALIEHHVPFDIVTVEDVLDGRLEEFRVMVLPEALRLSRATMDRIAAFVQAGGGLVFTGRSGWWDETRTRHVPNPLLELAGAEYMSTGSSIDPTRYPVYYRMAEGASPWTDLAGRLLSFRGDYVVTRPTGGASVAACIEDVDYSRFHKEHMIEGAYPGAAIAPMILTRQVGGGRVVFIAASLAASARQIGDREAGQVLARAAVWAAGTEPPVRVDAPPSVEAITHVGPGKLAIFLINQSTNQVTPSSVIRYVVPVSDVEVAVKTGSAPSQVTAITGQAADWSYDHGWLHVRLDRLNEYEVLLVDL
jgi:hypothetical protein